MIIGKLNAGDGVVTVFNESFVPQFILIGGVGAANVVQKLEVSIGGQDFQNVTGVDFVTALTELEMKSIKSVAGYDIGRVYRIADGFIGGQNIQVRFTNESNNTPDVFFFSMRKGTTPVSAGQETVQRLSSRPFGGFSHLIFSSQIDYAQVEFIDGHSEKLTPIELNARFAMMESSDGEGTLAGFVVVDNSFGDIATLTLYTSNVAAVTVTKVLM